MPDGSLVYPPSSASIYEGDTYTSPVFSSDTPYSKFEIQLPAGFPNAEDVYFNQTLGRKFNEISLTLTGVVQYRNAKVGSWALGVYAYGLYGNGYAGASWTVHVFPGYSVVVETNVDGSLLDFATTTKIMGITKDPSKNILYTFKKVKYFSR